MHSAGGASNQVPTMDTIAGVLKGCYDLGADLWSRHREVAAISFLTVVEV